MATPLNRKKNVRDIIREEVAGLDRVGNEIPDDDEYVPGAQRITPFGFSGLRKSEDEVLIDELFAGVDESKGFYLRLEKETSPNDYQFKEKITKYKHWSDFTSEVSDFVRAKTRLEIERTGKAQFWGSGRYRISVWHPQGMRDKKQSIVFDVDAKEYEIPVPGFPSGVIPQQSPQSEQISEILRTIQSTQVSPTTIVEKQAEAMKAGMELAARRDDGANSSSDRMTQLMLGMMQSMQQSNATIIAAIMGKPVAPTVDPITTFRDMMAISKSVTPEVEKAPTLIEQVRTMRELGLIQAPTNVDPMEQMQKFKQLASLFTDLTGSKEGERPGIIEKIIDGLVPMLPGMIGNISNTVSKVADMKRMQLQQQQSGAEVRRSTPIQQEVTTPTPVISSPTQQPQQSTPPPTTEDEMNLLKLMTFGSELYKAVMAKDENQYNYISETLQSYFGPEVISKLSSGDVTKMDLIGYIKQFDTSHYRNEAEDKALTTYVDSYILYIRNNSKTFDTRCNKCGEYSTFDSRQDWEQSDKICDINQCGGNLEEIK